MLKKGNPTLVASNNIKTLVAIWFKFLQPFEEDIHPLFPFPFSLLVRDRPYSLHEPNRLIMDYGICTSSASTKIQGWESKPLSTELSFKEVCGLLVRVLCSNSSPPSAKCWIHLELCKWRDQVVLNLGKLFWWTGLARRPVCSFLKVSRRIQISDWMKGPGKSHSGFIWELNWQNNEK